MEHILQQKKCRIRNGTLKKAKAWRWSEGWVVFFFHIRKVEGEKKQQANQRMKI